MLQLLLVGEEPPGLLGSLLKDCRGADNVTPADVPVVDLAQRPQSECLVGDWDLSHFLPESLPGGVEQLDPLLTHRPARGLRRVVLGHQGAVHVKTELDL
ncbi:hypothetical protein G6F68_014097 [Rhizopus microsporus]|nr:hypothetical protein G6F68_014097 [Rhizopus microsporus]